MTVHWHLRLFMTEISTFVLFQASAGESHEVAAVAQARPALPPEEE